MKEKLVKALTMLGLNRMAVAVVGASDETPETMAQAMAAQVDAEVAERVAAHPLLLQCGACGITTPQDFERFSNEALLGRQYLGDLRQSAKHEAVRAFGAEQGPAIGAQVDHLPVAQVKLLLTSWQKQADSQMGIGTNGEPAQRRSAPLGNPESATATAGADGKQAEAKTAWEQLSAEQQKTIKMMGADTPEKQEAYAKEYFAVREQARAEYA